MYKFCMGISHAGSVERRSSWQLFAPCRTLGLAFTRVMLTPSGWCGTGMAYRVFRLFWVGLIHAGVVAASQSAGVRVTRQMCSHACACYHDADPAGLLRGQSLCCSPSDSKSPGHSVSNSLTRCSSWQRYSVGGATKWCVGLCYDKPGCLLLLLLWCNQSYLWAVSAYWTKHVLAVQRAAGHLTLISVVCGLLCTSLVATVR